MQRIAVVALGGNAFQKEGKALDTEQQFNYACKVVSKVIKLLDHRYRIIFTHGNGPQVGNALLRAELAKGKAYDLPLDVCGAQSQGELGYVLLQSFYNCMKKQGKYRPIIYVLTQTKVLAGDKAFKNPSKPVGPYYSRKKAMELKKRGWKMAEDSRERGWRRVVPSPEPIKVVEARNIKALVREGAIVIACGGGGVPVIEQGHTLLGVEAVIDKDLASAVLAKEAGAEAIFILTDVKEVYINYRKKGQKALRKVKARKLRKYYDEGQFAAGSMRPKIRAALNFLGGSGKAKKVVITDLKNLDAALEGKTGTTITH